MPYFAPRLPLKPDQPVLQGAGDGLRLVCGTELVARAHDVGRYGALRDAEDLAGQGGGLAGCSPDESLLLPVGQ